MKIVVLVKEVPDTYGDRKLTSRPVSPTVPPPSGCSTRSASVPSRWRCRTPTPGTEVTVVSMAPEESAATIRKGLAMGAASALQVVDPALAGADLGVTAPCWPRPYSGRVSTS